MLTPPNSYKPRIVIDLPKSTLDLFRSSTPWGSRNEVCLQLIRSFVALFLKEGPRAYSLILNGGYELVLVKKEVSKSVEPE